MNYLNLFYRLYFKLLILFISILFYMNHLFAINKINSIVAVVNDEIITQLDLNNAWQTRYAQPIKQAKNSEIKQFLQSLIDEKMQLQIAKQNKITVSETQLQNTIKQIAQENKMSLQEFIRTIKKQGLNFTQYQHMLHDKLVINTLLRQVIAPKLKITDEAIAQEIKRLKQKKEFYNYHLANILLPNNKKTLSTVVEELKNKANFHQVATQYSISSNAKDGGDMHWRQLENIPLIFHKYLSNMKINEISEPIKIKNGFFIFKLLAKKLNLPQNSKISSQNFWHMQAMKILENKSAKILVDEWLHKLREDSYIKLI